MFKKIRLTVLILIISMPFCVAPAFAEKAFSDIDGNASAGVIERWQNANLVCGYPDGTFRPDVVVTRAQFAKIITELFVLESTQNVFSDVPSDAWYNTYANKASAYMGFELNGESKVFNPEKPMSVNEVYHVLSGLIQIPEDTEKSFYDTATREKVITFIDSILGGSLGFEYMLSVIDAHTIEEDELHPLVSLDRGSDMATFNDKGQVLLLSWHKNPESYIAGQQLECGHGEIWTFTDKEILAWYETNGNDVLDWELRLEQLIGLPPAESYTHVSAFWVDVDDVIRPSYQTDVTGQITFDTLDGSKLFAHQKWFYDNYKYSYETSAYPWTRLGYTYDWADNGTEYGLSEFLILPDSAVKVKWTKSLDEFVDWMAENR